MSRLFLPLKILLFFYLSQPLLAQYELQGQVSEPTGPVVGATVLLLPDSLVQTTDEQGQFSFSHLSAGNYTLQLSYIGFKQIRQSVQVPQSAPLSLSLKEEASVLNEVEIHEHQEDDANRSLSKERLDESFFEGQAAGTFAERLSLLAGVQAQTVGVGVARPVIRGFSGNRITVNRYGIKQEGQQWARDHGLEVDPFSLKRVELLRGPGALRYGSDALGGVINILPPRLIPANQLEFSSQVQYKSNNAHWASSHALSFHKGAFFGHVRFSHQDFGDYRVPAESFIYNGFELPIFNQRLKNTAGQERNMEATLGVQREKWLMRWSLSRYGLKMGLFSGAVGRPRSYTVAPDESARDIDLPYQNVAHWNATWNGDFHLSSSRLLQVHLGYQDNLRREHSFPGFHNSNPLDSSDLALQLRLQSVQLRAVVEEDLPHEQRLEYGLSWQQQWNNRQGFEFLLPDFQTQRAGLFGVYYWQPHKKHRLSGGLRLDYGLNNTASFEQLQQGDDGNLYWNLRAAAQEKHFFNYAASLGWNMQIRPQRSILRAQFSKSFRIPYPNETSSNGIHHGSFRHEIGQPDLDSEQGYQFDLSWEINSGKWQSEWSAFANYIDDYIYLSPSAQFSTLPEAGQIFRYEQHNAFFTGGEWSWKWEAFKSLKLEQAYELVWNYNLETGFALPFTPPASILSQVNYTFKKGFLENSYVGISHRYWAAQQWLARNEQATPSAHLLHIAVGGELRLARTAITWQLQCRNLLNTPYLNHLSRYRLLNLPEQGRNVVVSLKMPLRVAI